VSYRRLCVMILLLLVGAAARRVQLVSAGDEWQPISQEELKMTSVPEAPGAPAVYLYRQVDRDDSGHTPHEYNYARIKILTEEGRKYADVEIPFFKDEGNIHSIKARTIRPDGSIVNFEGKAFDKTIVKAKGLKYLAKTFTLPDVQVGSIVEYHYLYDLSEGYVYNSRWILSEELFTKRAKFSLKPNTDFALRWSWPAGLPAGTAQPKNEGGFVRLESQNIPAFQIEDYMPPQNELKFRVDFAYSESDAEKEPDKFWKKEGKKLNDRVESFTGKRKAMEQAVAETVAPNDTPEVKLQKIYAKVQKFRNTSWETEKTDQELKREKQKDINNVEDLWKRGYGNGRQINWLFLAMARAAGFEAYSVYISSRSEYFFNPQLMNPNQLNGDVVLVKLNGKEVYCDPATAFAPFGLLSWPETGVKGLRLDKEGGSWVMTTLPPSSDSRIERKADLKLTQEGALEGKLTVTFSGLEALWRRIEERNEDATNRKKFLEDQVKEYIPVGVELDLTNQPNWGGSTPTLAAEFELKVPGWVSGAGRRALVPVGLFSAPEKHAFEHANRVHAIYFSYPSEKFDDVTIDLPLGWQVSSLPPVQNLDAKAALYNLKVENNKGTLHLTRQLNMDLLMVEVKLYPTLRNFFQVVRTGDEQQIVLQPGVTAAGN
jgi:transglutaminase-like putative cysteine protease